MTDAPVKQLPAPCEKHRPGPAARTAARLGGKVPVIDTKRLQLRGPRVYDFKVYADILTSDRAVHRDRPYTRAQAWGDFTNYVACWMLHGHGLWTIDAATTPTAGFVLLGYDWADPEPELNIFLSDVAEGHGYALEALEAARDHAFSALKWDSVVSYVAADNERGNRLMKRAGARRDAQAEAALGLGQMIDPDADNMADNMAHNLADQRADPLTAPLAAPVAAQQPGQPPEHMADPHIGQQPEHRVGRMYVWRHTQGDA